MTSSYPPGVTSRPPQVTNELKDREVANQEKEDSMLVKKQTVDLLPDAENNLAKLQVRAYHHHPHWPSSLGAGYWYQGFTL